ncbi:MAG: 3-oxoacyl-ACP reductase [Bacteroidota bacterium]
MHLADQTVLITGASRGLGAALARAFAREGARVVVNYFQSYEAAKAVVTDIAEAGGQAFIAQADVRNADAVQRMVADAEAHFGTRITTSVHNALVDYRFDPTTMPTAATITWEHYLRQLEGSVLGLMNVVQATMPAMTEAGGGCVIAIGSNLVQNPVVPYHDYTTGKAALLGAVRNLAQDLGPQGITVNLVSGGLLRTTDASAATSAEVFGIIEATTPLRRVTTPEEMADAVLFFASPWARAVTGQNLVVDGGLVKN